MTVDAAASELLADAAPGPSQRLPLRSAIGCHLAEPARALRSSPPWDCAAMDGIVVAEIHDIEPGSTWHVSTTITAGMRRARLDCGAARIMTGAPLPVGSTTVIPVEALELSDDGTVATCLESVRRDSHIRRCGEDCEIGSVVVPAGTRITPFHVAALSAAAVDFVEVVRQPTIQIIVTGDEIVASSPEPHQVVDAAGPAIAALAKAAGAVVRPDILCDDDRARLSDAIRCAANEVDLVITIGGIGPGLKDLVVPVADALGAVEKWHLAMKPGKPFGYGTVASARFVALPGNPGAAITAFSLLVDPVIRALSGSSTPNERRVVAIAAEAVCRSPDGRTHVLRAIARVGDSGCLAIHVLQGQGSHQLRLAASTNCLAVIPDGRGIAAGQSLEVVLVGDLLNGPA